MIDWLVLLPLFTMGLVSGAHCIGMCGGIMGALTMAIPADAQHKRWGILITYNIGRILSYGFIGLLAGFFAQAFAALGGAIFLRIIAGILLISMGLYLADWWRGLTKLETLGRYIWVYIQPLGKGLMPVNTMPKALLLGALWGWLPCGLVYAALASAMAQPVPLVAAGAMFAFGVGTLPAVLIAGVAAQQLTRFLQRRNVRIVLALLMVIYGVWTIYGALGGHAHQHQATHQEHDHSHMTHDAMQHTMPSSEESSEASSGDQHSMPAGHEHMHHNMPPESPSP